MRKITPIFLFLFFASGAGAQTSFKTIVPPQALVTGESFQVQYILEDADKTTQVKPPIFANFRFVTGPYIHMGSVSTAEGTKLLRNTVYTLEATRPGKFIIPGATITVNGKMIKSNDARVEVISKAEALKRFEKENALTASDYFLRPGENAYEKIRQNLFVKMMVDKRTCYVGEPILATYKLYSRLESRSDIVKNPGFYGFTVYDMVNLSDKQVTTENVDGKAFDVHTIRKVQLYPLQAGEFTIDPMMVMNKVEFSKSAVYKKTEQEIVEGANRRFILRENDEEDNEKPPEGISVFETELNTEPITIKVKPIPERNKPAAFNGAIGDFKISSRLVNDSLRKNEEGFFEITLTGKGNFIQLSAPAVQWPAGIEGFEPVVMDNLDKTKMPLAGSRTFRYPFVCGTAGNWQLPPVSFSFFDIDSNKFKTVSTNKVEVVSTNEEKEKPVIEEKKVSISEKSEKAARTAGIIIVSLVLVIVAYWIFKKKEPEVLILPKLQTGLPSANDLLEPALAAVTVEGNSFYRLLYKGIWDFVTHRFGLTGSEMSKQILVHKMSVAGVPGNIIAQLSEVLGACEAGMFTSASLEHNKEELFSLVKKLLNTIGETAPGPGTSLA
jgi:hypothetical protein